MKYTIKKITVSPGEIWWKAYDDKGEYVLYTSSCVSADACEQYLRATFEPAKYVAEEFVREVELDDHTPICGECGETHDDCACETAAPEGDLNAIL